MNGILNIRLGSCRMAAGALLQPSFSSLAHFHSSFRILSTSRRPHFQSELRVLFIVNDISSGSNRPCRYRKLFRKSSITPRCSCNLQGVSYLARRSLARGTSGLVGCITLSSLLFAAFHLFLFFVVICCCKTAQDALPPLPRTPDHYHSRLLPLNPIHTSLKYQRHPLPLTHRCRS